MKALVGSGDRIALFTLPFVAAGLALNLAYPFPFDVGGPSASLRDASIAVLIVGVTTWAWSAGLVLSKVPHKELITGGPFSVLKHPLYTAVALLVLPWAAFLVNSWLGAVIGAVMYVGSRIFAPAEEVELSQRFGEDWVKYCASVKIPWL